MSSPKAAVADPEVGISAGIELSSIERENASKLRGGLLPRYWYLFLLAAILSVLYYPILKALVLNWEQDPDYGHGFVVPIFAGYALWRSRRHWQNLGAQPHNFGLVVVLFGILLLILGSLGAELFLSRISLLVVLAGVVLYLFGEKALWVVSFPLCFLLFMIPLPAIIYNQVTFSLEQLASRLAAAGLDAIQVPVLREGNLLMLPGHSLDVAEACSGIRSLMALLALAIAYGYLIGARIWVRLMLATFMIPIAIFSNGFRIFGAGLCTYFFGSNWAEGFFHIFSGWLIFVTALLSMLLAHWSVMRVTGLFRKASHA